LEEPVEIAKELLLGLLRRMEIETEVEGGMREGVIYLEIKSDEGGILIGKHGRTLESFQMLLNRMVARRVKETVRVILDIAQYRKRRMDSLVKMATRLGENAKRTGKGITVGPYNAHDRRIIHVTLKEDPLLQTESIGEGEMKRLKIIPTSKERGRLGPLE